MIPGFLRQGIWKKAYLLEFYDNEYIPIPTDTFTFGVPPQSEEITLGMRKTETKTFGGLVVDDYGCDNAVKITLTGSTVNNELRKIYNPYNPINFKTGEEEIYTFKKFIEKCKKRENINGKILLYDLSKHTTLLRKMTLIEPFCWRVFPGELKIKRGKENPFAYTYSIEFTAIPEINTPKLPKLAKIDKLTAVLNNIENLLNTAMNILKQAFDRLSLKKVLDQINTVRRIVNSCKELITAPVKYGIEGIINVVNEAMDVADSVIALWKETAGGVVPWVAEMHDFVTLRVTDLLYRGLDLANNIKAIGTKEFYVPKKSVDLIYSNSQRFETILDNLERCMTGVYKETVSLSFMTKTILPDQIALHIPVLNEDDKGKLSVEFQELEVEAGPIKTLSVNGDDAYSSNTNKQADIKAYGFKTETITEGTTFENLAVEHYGDITKADLIATVNNASNIEEIINLGQTRVLLPILERTKKNDGNLIIGLSKQRDSYGVDIALDEQGNMNFDETGFEFKLVRGKDNLSQAILSRLKESVNKRVRLQYYGLKTTLPDEPTVSNAYIFLSILQTLKMEPRIKEILGLYFKQEGDVLRIDIDYTDISGEAGNFQGVI